MIKLKAIEIDITRCVTIGVTIRNIGRKDLKV